MLSRPLSPSGLTRRLKRHKTSGLQRRPQETYAQSVTKLPQNRTTQHEKLRLRATSHRALNLYPKTEPQTTAVFSSTPISRRALSIDFRSQHWRDRSPRSNWLAQRTKIARKRIGHSSRTALVADNHSFAFKFLDRQSMLVLTVWEFDGIRVLDCAVGFQRNRAYCRDGQRQRTKGRAMDAHFSGANGLMLCRSWSRSLEGNDSTTFAMKFNA